MSRAPVDLIRRSDGALVEATLIDGVQPEDLVFVERDSWGRVRAQIRGKLRAGSVPRAEWPQSLHWDWSRKAAELTLLEVTGFAILCDEDWQAIMLTKTASYTARLSADKGKPLVYIDYIETASWNWPLPALGEGGRYKGVGLILIREAVKQSYREGFHGRVGLHALQQAEGLYKRCGMTPVAHDEKKQGLLYFEFSPAQAKKFMEEGGEQ